MHYANPAVTAFAFVQRDDQFLVLQRDQEPYRGRWELPGGFVNERERPADGVRREIYEETGLCVDEPCILGAYTSRYGDDGKWTVDVAFHCRTSQGELRLSVESSDAAWVEIEHVPALAFAGERSAFEDFKKKLAAG